jgi:transglutaminase-like putative cysteine protease
MRLSIRHEVRCRYDPPAVSPRLYLHLLPPDDEVQDVESWDVFVDVPDAKVEKTVDGYGNRALSVEMERPVEAFGATARGVVRTRRENPFDFGVEDGAVLLVDEADYAARDTNVAAMRRDFSDAWDASPAVAAFARETMGPDGSPSFAACQRLNRAIHEGFRFERGRTSVDSGPDDVLRTRAGVCQDFATLFVAAVRSRGLAARYVSGYVYDGPPEGRPVSSATHAWVEVRFSRIGWRGFDPTNGILAAATHVRLAAGRWFRDVAPLSGAFAAGGTRQSPTDAVDVRILTP